MSLINELRNLIDDYERSENEPKKYHAFTPSQIRYETVSPHSAPFEWTHLPINADEGRRIILTALRDRQTLPSFVQQEDGGKIHYYCGPVSRCPTNPNGFMRHSGTVHAVDIIYAIVDGKVD